MKNELRTVFICSMFASLISIIVTTSFFVFLVKPWMTDFDKITAREITLEEDGMVVIIKPGSIAANVAVFKEIRAANIESKKISANFIVTEDLIGTNTVSTDELNTVKIKTGLLNGKPVRN